MSSTNADQSALTVSGANVNVTGSGPQSINPFAGSSTPLITGVVGGAEAFGVTALTAQDTFAQIDDRTSSLTSFTTQGVSTPPDVGIAVLDDVSEFGLSDADFNGFDLLLILNLAEVSLGNTLITYGDSTTSLITGGFDSIAEFGGSGPNILNDLASNNVYAAIVPELEPDAAVRLAIEAESGLLQIDQDEFIVLDSDGTEGLRLFQAFELSSMLVGDYNGNGVVDAADYTVWADNFGSMAALAADGNGNGVVDAADYTIWADNFGTSNASAQGLALIPEPGTLALLALGVPLIARRRTAA